MSNQEWLVDNNIPIVYHSHDAQLQLDPDTPVLHVIRKDLFNEIISAVISEQYNEWYSYTGNKSPFTADLCMFEQKYFWHKHWHNAHRALTNYTNRQDLIFEEFIGKSEVICNQLNIPIVTFNTNKSPYSQANILNINELKEKFSELEAQPTSVQRVAEQWKDSRVK